MKKLLIFILFLVINVFPIVQMLSTAPSGTNVFNQMLGQSTNLQTLVSNNGLFLWELSGSNTFYTNGRVGVGTNDPQKTFHLLGDSILGGTVDIEGNNIIGVGQIDVQTINAFGGTKITFIDDLDLGGKIATNFPEPTFSNAAATKFYVDSATIHIGGNFVDTNDQSITNVSTPQTVAFSTIKLIDGMLHTLDSSIFTINTDGVYMMIIAPQLSQGAGSATVEFWIRKNGVDIVDSGVQETMSPSSEKLPLFRWKERFVATDTFEIIWASDSLNTMLDNITSLFGGPNIPSITLGTTHGGD